MQRVINKKSLGIVLILFFISSCANFRLNRNQEDLKKVKLDFSECTIAFNEYSAVSIFIPKKYRKKRLMREGLCEYDFFYKDSSVLYISTDVWIGSQINFSNRASIGHSAYFKESLNDTIVISGIQKNGTYWKESILGNILVGYANVPFNRKEQFDQIVFSLSKE